jgi:anti-sigma factor RsiW
MSAVDKPSCAEMEALLAERASGPLEADQAALLDKHLAGCARCRAAAAQYEALFSLMALPPPRLKEEAALRNLPNRTLAAWRKQEGRKHRAGRVASVAGPLAAAVLALVLWQRPPRQAVPVVATSTPTETVQTVQVEWTDGSTWQTDEPEVAEPSADEAVLDGLALEGDGAFSLGDSG